MNTEKEKDKFLKRLNGLKGVPQSRGTTLLKKHLKGEQLTRGEAIIAKCSDCNGYYVDGRLDCEIFTCPLYYYMPYRGRHYKT